MHILVDRTDEMRLRKELEARTDVEALRIKRYLAMADLSRTAGSPLADIVARTRDVPAVQGFDDIEIPEIVPASISFDLFDFAPEHPARSTSDTYYVDPKHILRTHDTVFWYYYLSHPGVQKRIAQKESLGALCYGKVYRKDEIDRRHMNIFHQMGGWFLQPNEKGLLTLDDLKEALSEIIKTVFGAHTEFRFNVDTFPYTDPSLEVEVLVNDQWVEVLGGGMPKASVLRNMGLEGYNGWAFGFGLERLAILSMSLPDIRLLWSTDVRVQKQLVLGQEYKEVSKYPPIIRDISFIVSVDFVPNDYFDLVREVAGDLVEEVALIDRYENTEKFGEGNVSYAYRITYRSILRTLESEEIDTLHKKLEQTTTESYNALVR